MRKRKNFNNQLLNKLNIKDKKIVTLHIRTSSFYDDKKFVSRS